jgi:aryl-alcohol dehydrogenase-like predicted oxidoreductase
MGNGPNDQGLSRRHIMDAVRASLRRLQVETIDLYQTHSPDDSTPLEETLRALDDLIRAGMVRYIGCSNYPAWRLMQALWTSDRNGLSRFVCLQPHYNLLHRDEFERELESVCRTYGLGVIPYSPLAGGFLTGKYTRQVPWPSGSRGAESLRIQAYGASDRAWAVLDSLTAIGHGRGRSASQVALAWLSGRPAVTSPIVGPRSIQQLADNLGAVGFRLSADEEHQLEEATAWGAE